MALRDASCYTLLLRPFAQDPSIIQLVEPAPSIDSREEARYARVREKRENEAYSAGIYDPLTGARLASAGYDADKAKRRRLQLHGPDEDVPFEQTGKLNFEWTFLFEGNKYRWTRELYGKDYICSLDRKPDPRVEIALARDADKTNPGRLQILHYNIERFPDEIRDLKGLETLVVASLLCLMDAAEDRSNGSGPKLLKNPTPPPKPIIGTSSPPPTLPPAHPQRVISAEDFEPENPNEIVVTMNSVIDDHIARAVGLLEDPKILFVVIRTKTAAATQRALQVSLGVTRFRHREGLPDLHQYVIEEEPPEPKPAAGPKIIKLDDEPTAKPNKGWSPPKNIAIYLSSIELPDLKPGRRDHLSKNDRSELNNPNSTSLTATSQPKPRPSPSPTATPVTSDQNSSSKGSKGSAIGKLFRL